MGRMTEDRRIYASAPHFVVSDLAKSAAYYADALGFRAPRLWGDPPAFAIVSRDDIRIMLTQAGDGSHVRPHGPAGSPGESFDAYFWARDVDALCAEMKANGAHVVFGPVDRRLFGLREIGVRDPDGYVLIFAHDLPACGRPAGARITARLPIALNVHAVVSDGLATRVGDASCRTSSSSP
jgi:catechol 2,3-dioxygenase-like lactoylglutathione lyase family enzyme